MSPQGALFNGGMSLTGSATPSRESSAEGEALHICPR